MMIKDKIRELRKQHGLSQRKISKIIGVSPLVVCRWESGKHEPTIYHCIQLADLFNVSLDELCCRDFKGGK